MGSPVERGKIDPGLLLTLEASCAAEVPEGCASASLLVWIRTEAEATRILLVKSPGTRCRPRLQAITSYSCRDTALLPRSTVLAPSWERPPCQGAEDSQTNGNGQFLNQHCLSRYYSSSAARSVFGQQSGLSRCRQVRVSAPPPAQARHTSQRPPSPLTRTTGVHGNIDGPLLRLACVGGLALSETAVWRTSNVVPRSGFIHSTPMETRLRS